MIRVRWVALSIYGLLVLFGFFQLVDYHHNANISFQKQVEQDIATLESDNEILRKKLHNLVHSPNKTNTSNTSSTTNTVTPPIFTKEWKTTWKCYRREDLSDICVYKQLCYDGTSIIFLDPDTPKSESLYSYPLKGAETALRFEYTYWQPATYPPPPSQYVPYMSTWSFNDKYPFKVNAESVLDIADTIEVFPGSVYYGAFDMNPDNVYHNSMQALNLWDSQILNETLGESDKLPPQDLVVLRRPFIHPGWERKTYQAMVQNHTQFVLMPWFYPNDTDLQSTFRIMNNYFEVEWHDEDYINFTPPQREHFDVQVNNQNLFCSEDAVIISQKPRLFSGLYSSLKYRERLYEQTKASFNPPKGTVKHKEDIIFSGKVLIDYRGERLSRNLLNKDDIADMVSYYQLEPIVMHSYRDGDTLEKQLADVSSVDVYIIVHGAGITNEILMTPHSSVIEIFPYGMRAPMYKYAAATLDIHHIEIVSWLKGDNELGCGDELFKPPYYQFCQNTSNMEHSRNACVLYSKNACVRAPLYDVELALISAYDYIGVNLNPRVSELYSLKHNATMNNFHNAGNFKRVEPNE